MAVSSSETLIDMNSTPGLKHSDGMQFWNTGSNNPSSDLVIADNVIRTHNDAEPRHLHGQCRRQLDAATPAPSSRTSRSTDNIVVSGDGFGIAWGQTDGLDISDNIILRDMWRSRAPGAAPRTSWSTRIPPTSRSPATSPTCSRGRPMSSGSRTNRAEPGWTIANNKIVPIGTTLQDRRRARGPPRPLDGRYAGGAFRQRSRPTPSASTRSGAPIRCWRLRLRRGRPHRAAATTPEGSFQGEAGGNPLQVSRRRAAS